MLLTVKQRNLFILNVVNHDIDILSVPLRTLTNRIRKLKTENKSNLFLKDLKLRGKTFVGLIDTGADVCLMRVDVLFTIRDVNLIKDRVKLCGISQSEITTLGRFSSQFLSMEIIFMFVFI